MAAVTAVVVAALVAAVEVPAAVVVVRILRC